MITGLLWLGLSSDHWGRRLSCDLTWTNDRRWIRNKDRLDVGVDRLFDINTYVCTSRFPFSGEQTNPDEPRQGCDPPHGPNQMTGACSCNCRCGCIIDHDPELDWWRECRQCDRQVGAECCWSGYAEAMCHWCRRWGPCYITSLPLEAEGWRHCVAAMADFVGGEPPLQAQVVLGQTCRSLHKWFSDKFEES